MGRTKDLGVTLLELLAAMAILTIVGLFATPIIFSAYRSFEASNAQMRLQNHIHITMRQIVDYVDDSIPLPVTNGVGEESVDIISSTEMNAHKFVNPRDPNSPQPSDFTDARNYVTTTIKFDDASGRITAAETGGAERTLGVPEKKQAGAPEPVTFTRAEFMELLVDPKDTKSNVVSITLEAEVKTKYGNVEKAALTVTATARGRRAGD